MQHRLGLRRTIATYLEAIKISHSVFALPFAIAAAFLAARDRPELLRPLLVLKIVLACVAARTAAMSFNRFADAEIDRANPRTAGRAVPRGLLSRRFMALATLVSAAAFVACAAWINRLAFSLSPIALAVVLGYSYTKRFTSLSHLVLGAALGLSPLGAWIAVREEFALVPVILGCAVLFWTAGFDIIYATLDHDFDARFGLESLPRRLGIAGALRVSRLFHVFAAAGLAAAGVAAGAGAVYFAGAALCAALLVYEHSIVRPDDLSRVDTAFFTLNGLVSLLFMGAAVWDTVLSW